MKGKQSFINRWTGIVLDDQLTIVEVSNPNRKLFYGNKPESGIHITSLFPDHVQGQSQKTFFVEGIRRAQKKKESTYLEHYSTCDGETVTVTTHVECCDDGTICLYSLPVYPEIITKARNSKGSLDDFLSMHSSKQTPDKFENLYKRYRKVLESLPIGIALYDLEGTVIFINDAIVDIYGFKKEQMLERSFNLFDNPVLPQEMKNALRDRIPFQTELSYDFNYIAESGYYESSHTNVRWIEICGTPIRNIEEEIDCYVFVSKDVTDGVSLQTNYESLYNKMYTIVNSLPVGVEVYGKDGQLLFLNDTDFKIFGLKKDSFDISKIDIWGNPNLSTTLKEDVSKGLPTHAIFPYYFDKVNDTGFYSTSQQGVLQIECSGCPVLDNSGQLESYVFIVADVTESISINEELRQSKRKTELAMTAADIMLWEFEVSTQLFYSENEPVNGYKSNEPLTIEQYMQYVDRSDHEKSYELFKKLCAGEDTMIGLELRMKIPGRDDWQYCTINGSPFEKDSSGKVTKYIGVRKNNTDLQKRKLLQENILNSIPLPILIKNINDNYRYTFCNEESMRMFGSSVDKTIYDLMEAEEVAHIEKTDREVYVTGKPYLGLEHIRLKDGRTYDMIVRKSIIYDDGKRLLLTVRWDQSLQNELERRSKLFTLTLEYMHAFTWFYEPDKMQITFGDGFEKNGRKASEVNTLVAFLECVHPEDRDRFVASLEEVVSKDSGFWDVECRVDLAKSGVYEWVQARGILETAIVNDVPTKYMFGMTISVDEHKKTEMILRKSKEDLDEVLRQNEMVLNNTNSGLAYITTDYIVQWENISACSASLSHEAYKKGELCYKSTHGRTTPCETCVMQRALISGQVEQVEFCFDNGHTVEIFATPVFGDDNTMDGVVVRLDDVTEREQMIEELRQAKLLAEQSDKLKSAFLANMSHEIRTPLNAIVGFSGLLMEATEDEEKEEFIKIINNNNEMLLKLISDILDLSKIEAGSVDLVYEQFDLAEYFNEMAISMKQRMVSPNVRLIVSNPYSNCTVTLDKNRIAQIITNYVTNSIKYTPEGTIEMGYKCVENGVKFYVRDSGIGIPDEKKNRVFGRFEKLDEFAQGTGLGLSICKAIAQSMGGSVGFLSTYGKGSEFWVILPCKIETNLFPEQQSEAEYIDAVEKENVTEEGLSRRKTILVAEDIPSNYLLVSALLKKQYNIVHAKNGQEAIEIIRDQPLDLLLMDMKMPQIDGLTATVEIRKFNTRIPIIALTAHAFETDRQAALDAGCNDYLVKPIDKEKLLAVLDKYCPVKK